MIQFFTQNSKITNWLAWDDINTDELVGKIDLRDVNETTLKGLFNLNKNSLLSDCYPLPTDQTKAMQQILGERVLIAPASYEYFLEMTTAA